MKTIKIIISTITIIYLLIDLFFTCPYTSEYDLIPFVLLMTVRIWWFFDIVLYIFLVYLLIYWTRKWET